MNRNDVMAMVWIPIKIHNLTKREIPKVFTEVNLNGNNDNDDDNNDNYNNDNNSSNNLKQNYDFQINASVKSHPIQYH